MLVAVSILLVETVGVNAYRAARTDRLDALVTEQLAGAARPREARQVAATITHTIDAPTTTIECRFERPSVSSPD